MIDILKVQRLIPLFVVNTDGSFAGKDHCLFRYCSTMPWGVAMLFRDRECTVEWNIDRATLAEGIDMEAGEGDVHVLHVEDGVQITLSPNGNAPTIFLFDRDLLLEFLDSTWQLVEAGSESAFFKLPDDVIGSVETAGDY
jgi:hypothetical protein